MSATPPGRSALRQFIHDYRVLIVGIPFLVAVHLAWHEIQMNEKIRPEGTVPKDTIFSRMFSSKK